MRQSFAVAGRREIVATCYPKLYPICRRRPGARLMTSGCDIRLTKHEVTNRREARSYLSFIVDAKT
jgi:hypothetical protein